jgi:hypothetical protein
MKNIELTMDEVDTKIKNDYLDYMLLQMAEQQNKDVKNLQHLVVVTKTTIQEIEILKKEILQLKHHILYVCVYIVILSGIIAVWFI